MSGVKPPLRPLELDDLRNLSISDQNELYWKGERVEVKRRVNLTWPQTVGAILVGAAAICGGFASAANDGSEFTCRQWHLFCGDENAGAPAIKPAVKPASDRSGCA
jgi:hypothetical protein